MSISRQQAEGMMMDLLYGELAESDRPALEAYLASDAELRAEYESLQGVRAVLADVRTEAAAEASTPTPPPRRRGLRFLRVLVPIAAAAVILVAFWVMQSPDTPGVDTSYAGPAGPVSIEQLNVSLTILSKPAPKHGGYHPGMKTQQWLSPQAGLAGWSGMALVRDRRLGRNLPLGQGEVSFTGVPSGILPNSVRLRSVDDPDGLSILEQNYQYDLASASAILDRYIEKDVAVAFKDDTHVTGRLVSVAKSGQYIQSFTIQPLGEGPRIIEARQVASVSLAKLPEGLLTTPTLVWTLDNRRQQPQQFEVAYLTKGLSWRADYMLTLRAADATQNDGALFDLADLTGYATVTNQSGVTYKDAQLKLMAGDVNLVQPEMPMLDCQTSAGFYMDGDRLGRERWGFQQKSFFEYHLYTLGRPTTLADRETKQIELVTGSGMKMKRGYVYDPQRGNKRNMLVVSELKNTEENGLGKPLPKGVVRLYAPDPEGELQPVGRTEIDHTPVKEKLRFQWGMAFDLVGEFRELDARYSRRSGDMTYEYRLRNHKSHPVTITVIVHVPATTYELTCWRDANGKAAGGKPLPWHIRQVGMVEIDVLVPANGARTIYVPYAWRSENGGNLKSPYDNKKEE